MISTLMMHYLNEAQRLSGQSTYDATVNLALRELIQRRL
jgi:hypothetical protein